MDLSRFAKFEVTGADAEKFLNRIFANRMPRRLGGIGLAGRLSDGERIQSEATITRLADDRFYVLSGAAWQVRALDSLRMEKAYRGIGTELTNEITLVEADMERFLALAKNDFIGREASAALRDGGISTKLVYLEVDAVDADVMGSEDVVKDGRVVGVTTSGAYGHAVRKSLAFAYVEPEFSTPGTTFHIPLLGQSCEARVLGEPAYDPESARLRG